MLSNAYAEIVADDQTGARRREYDALSKVIDQLMDADRVQSLPDIHAALDLHDALWSIFLEDLANAHNLLSEPLRAQLISIGLWAMRKSMSVRLSGGVGVGALVDICATLREGLKPSS